MKGDEEEDDIDDVDNEFSFHNGQTGHDSLSEAGFFQGHRRNMSYASSYEPHMDTNGLHTPPPGVPLITDAQMVI